MLILVHFSHSHRITVSTRCAWTDAHCTLTVIECNNFQLLSPTANKLIRRPANERTHVWIVPPLCPLSMWKKYPSAPPLVVLVLVPALFNSLVWGSFYDSDFVPGSWCCCDFILLLLPAFRVSLWSPADCFMCGVCARSARPMKPSDHPLHHPLTLTETEQKSPPAPATAFWTQQRLQLQSCSNSFHCIVANGSFIFGRWSCCDHLNHCRWHPPKMGGWTGCLGVWVVGRCCHVAFAWITLSFAKLQNATAKTITRRRQSIF